MLTQSGSSFSCWPFYQSSKSSKNDQSYVPFKTYDNNGTINIPCHNKNQKSILETLSSRIDKVIKLAERNSIDRNREAVKELYSSMSSMIARESDEDIYPLFLLFTNVAIMCNLAEISMDSYLDFLKPIVNRCLKDPKPTPSFDDYMMEKYGKICLDDSITNEYCIEYNNFKRYNPTNMKAIASNFITTAIANRWNRDSDALDS